MPIPYQITVLYDPCTPTTAFSAPFELSCEKSTQVPFHEQFTIKIGPFPVRVNQA
jgi:hypothetical protein